MLDFQALLQTIAQVSYSQSQSEPLRQAIYKRDHTTDGLMKATAPIPQNSPEWFSGLNAAIDQFWEGASEEDKAELLTAWNRGSIQFQ